MSNDGLILENHDCEKCGGWMSPRVHKIVSRGKKVTIFKKTCDGCGFTEPLEGKEEERATAKYAKLMSEFPKNK